MKSTEPKTIPKYMTEAKSQIMDRVLHIAARRGLRLRKTDFKEFRRGQSVTPLVRSGYLAQLWDKSLIPLMDKQGRHLNVRIERIDPLRTYVSIGHFMVNPVEALNLLGIKVIMYPDPDPSHPASPEAIQMYSKQLDATDRPVWHLYAEHGFSVAEVAEHIAERNLQALTHRIRRLRDGVKAWTLKMARVRVDEHAHLELPHDDEAIDWAIKFNAEQ